MLKSTGIFAEHAQRQASAAVEKAKDDLVMRQYLLERRPKEQQDASKPTPFIKAPNDPKQSESEGDSESESDDDEVDPFVEQYKARRMAELEVEFDTKLKVKPITHGDYEDVQESEFLRVVTSSEYVVCAFYHRDFERCLIVDKHISIIAEKHPTTKFIKVNAEKAQFFVQKLAIRQLPAILMFTDGIAVDRIVGFEELGGVDDFKTRTMEFRLAKSGVITFGNGKRVQKKINRSRVISE
eukprot:265675_1